MLLAEVEKQLCLRQKSISGKPFSEIEKYVVSCKESDSYPWELMFFEDFFKPESEEIGTIITLNKFEIWTSCHVGPLRTKAARAANMTNMIQAALPGTEHEKFIESNGLAGELSYAKMKDIYPFEQFRIEARTVQEDEGDHTVDGFALDIKTTEWPTGRLTLAPWKAHKGYLDQIQVLGLMVGDIGTNPRKMKCKVKGQYEWLGYLTAYDMVNREPRPLPGRQKPEYLADQTELYDWEEVIRRLK